MATVSLNLRMYAGKPDKVMEKIILNLDWEWYSASKAVEYCRKILDKRWPAAERKIKKVPYQCYLYARHVIKGKWEEAEPIIAKDDKASYLYAKFVLDGRFLLAEKNRIWTAPEQIYLYSKYILKGRWLEKEKYIEKIVKKNEDNYWYQIEDVVKYQINIRKERWKKIENAIVQSRFIKDYYNSLGETDKEDFYNKILAYSLVETEKWKHNYALDFIKNTK